MSEAIGVRLTGIFGSYWKQINSDKAENGWPWYRTLEAGLGERLVFGDYGLGPRGSYLTLADQTETDYRYVFGGQARCDGTTAGRVALIEAWPIPLGQGWHREGHRAPYQRCLPRKARYNTFSRRGSDAKIWRIRLTALVGLGKRA